MSGIWQRLAEKKSLDESMRAKIEELFGTQGKKALAALDKRKVKKYLDFFIVEGRTAEYIVDEDFCTCSDFIFRNRDCWHLIAVRIAEKTGLYEKVDSWYLDTWKK
jgi:predicted nucleic acid-binding Zn finger protein